jgi:hypothetical protein
MPPLLGFYDEIELKQLLNQIRDSLADVQVRARQHGGRVTLVRLSNQLDDKILTSRLVASEPPEALRL